MLPQIQRSLPRITELCRQYGVKRLELFGSALGDGFQPARSDVDFLVEFQDGGTAGAADRYFGLKDGLQSLMGRPVDLVVRTAIRNPYFRDAANQESLSLYAA